MASVITIKTALGGVLRRISVDTDKNTWADVEAKIKSLYGLEDQQNINVTYVDDDGDRITLSSTEEGA
jgi:hypothetical protein